MIQLMGYSPTNRYIKSVYVEYGIPGCGVFKETKLERFLAKNQLYSNEITKFWKLE